MLLVSGCCANKYIAVDVRMQKRVVALVKDGEEVKGGMGRAVQSGFSRFRIVDLNLKPFEEKGIFA